jgi:hypothetical protein
LVVGCWLLIILSSSSVLLQKSIKWLNADITIRFVSARQ